MMNLEKHLARNLGPHQNLTYLGWPFQVNLAAKPWHHAWLRINRFYVTFNFPLDYGEHLIYKLGPIKLIKEAS